jgi:hypothetical protein
MDGWQAANPARCNPLHLRGYHWTLMEIGLRYGSAVLLFGTAGVLCGGFFASHPALNFMVLGETPRERKLTR